MKDFTIALLGFGNVGQALATILLEKEEDVRLRYGRNIKVTAIATNSRGTLYDPEGIDLSRALDDLERCGHFDKAHPARSDLHAMSIAREGAYDALVEMTTLNIETGLPATDHIRSALARGKHAVTANKGPIAWRYAELRDLAAENDAQFYFESTVMDGTPLFNLVDETLRLCTVSEITGILNSTTNFILEQLEAGHSYEEALAKGRALGIVEADPSMDVDGHDPTAKIIAMANVLMDAGLTPADVERTGIGAIKRADLLAARDRGCAIKLVCRAAKEEGRVTATVRPEEVPEDSLFAAVGGTSAVYSILTDYMGRLTVVEHDALPLQTGYGVFGDLLRILEGDCREGAK